MGYGEEVSCAKAFDITDALLRSDGVLYLVMENVLNLSCLFQAEPERRNKWQTGRGAFSIMDSGLL